MYHVLITLLISPERAIVADKWQDDSAWGGAADQYVAMQVALSSL